MNTMKFDFASPSQYGDWATYAGFNRTTGEIEPSRMAEAVKPPENFGQFVDQRLSGIKNTASGIAPAFSQISQGNMMQGINTLRGVPIKQPAPVMLDNHDYTKGIED